MLTSGHIYVSMHPVMSNNNIQDRINRMTNKELCESMDLISSVALIQFSNDAFTIERVKAIASHVSAFWHGASELQVEVMRHHYQCALGIERGWNQD